MFKVLYKFILARNYTTERSVVAIPSCTVDNAQPISVTLDVILVRRTQSKVMRLQGI